MPKEITTAGFGEIDTVGILPKFDHVDWIFRKDKEEKKVTNSIQNLSNLY